MDEQLEMKVSAAPLISIPPHEHNKTPVHVQGESQESEIESRCDLFEITSFGPSLDEFEIHTSQDGDGSTGKAAEDMTCEKEPKDGEIKGPAAWPFEGDGMLLKSSGERGANGGCVDENEDEFGYVFDGKQRTHPPALPCFKHVEVPSHLVTNVKCAVLESVREGDSESVEDEFHATNAVDNPIFCKAAGTEPDTPDDLMNPVLSFHMKRSTSGSTTDVTQASVHVDCCGPGNKNTVGRGSCASQLDDTSPSCTPSALEPAGDAGLEHHPMWSIDKQEPSAAMIPTPDDFSNSTQIPVEKETSAATESSTVISEVSHGELLSQSGTMTHMSSSTFDACGSPASSSCSKQSQRFNERGFGSAATKLGYTPDFDFYSTGGTDKWSTIQSSNHLGSTGQSCQASGTVSQPDGGDQTIERDHRDISAKLPQEGKSMGLPAVAINPLAVRPTSSSMEEATSVSSAPCGSSQFSHKVLDPRLARTMSELGIEVEFEEQEEIHGSMSSASSGRSGACRVMVNGSCSGNSVRSNMDHKGNSETSAQWDANSERAKFMKMREESKRGEVGFPPEAYKRFETYFRSCSVSQYLEDVLESAKEPSTLLYYLSLCMLPPPLHSHVLGEKHRLLCLARLPFDHGTKAHTHLLKAVYHAYTGCDYTIASKGKHWENLGFQGGDPATDLRGGGILGLWLMYSLHHHHPTNAAAIYKLSQDIKHEFPFAIVCINVTVWAVQLIRANGMNAQANRIHSMIDATKMFHVGTMYEFFRLWKARGATMIHSGYVLKDLKLKARKSVQDMIDLSYTEDLRELVPWDENEDDCCKGMLRCPSCCTRRFPVEFTSISETPV